MEFNERLELALSKRNINQRKLSEYTGISVSSISDYIRGKNQPKYDKLKLIAESLNVSEDYLLGDTDHMEENPHVEGLIGQYVEKYEGIAEIIESVTVSNNIEFVNQLLNHYVDTKNKNDNTFENIINNLMRLNDQSLKEIENYTKWKLDNQ